MASTPVEPISQIPSKIAARGAAVYADVTGTSPESQGENPIVQGLQASGQAAGAVGDVSGSILSSLYQHIVPQDYQSKIATSVGNIAQGVGNTVQGIESTPGYVAASNAIYKWSQAHPQASAALDSTLKGSGAAGDVANTVIGAVGLAGSGGIVSQGAKDVNTALTDGTNIAKNSAGLGSTISNSDELTALSKDWEKPASVNKPSYSNAKKVLSLNPDSGLTLANEGLDPRAYIEDGKYDTADLQQSIIDAAGTESTQKLRPALQLADNYTPRTPVQQIVDDAINKANSDISLTPGARRNVINNINSEGAALAAENPDGLTLVSGHDNKITYSKNAGYKYNDTPSTANIATANRHLSSALGDMVENNAPSGIPVGQVNADLSKLYGAADYVGSLNGKVAPVSLAVKAARGAGRFGGALIARHFVGGDLVSDFAGYQIGKYVENALENMSHPRRAAFLKNLEKNEPQSYKDLQVFLAKNQAGNPDLLRLPAPSAPISPINNGNAIPVFPVGNTEYTGSNTVIQPK
jgi:hypothetical protein